MTLASGSLRFNVGGLSFVVRCASAVILADLDSPYLPFIDTGPAAPCDATAPPGGRAQGIDVEVRLDAPGDPAETAPLFESGQAWTMRADGDRRVVYHLDPRRTTPLLTMEFRLDVDRVIVWCDPDGWAPDAAGAGVPTPIRYPFDQILTMYTLARARGLLVHAAGVVLEDHALVCCGVSGAGKSTLARQFLSLDMQDLLSDDRVILRRQDAGWTAFGTPWAGDAGVAVNAGVPLGALLFLRQGVRNRLTPCEPGETLRRLLPVASIPWFDAAVMSSALSTCEELIAATPGYDLEFRPEPAAAELVRAFAAQPPC